jgi:predicted nucleic acid-binding protein
VEDNWGVISHAISNNVTAQLLLDMCDKIDGFSDLVDDDAARQAADLMAFRQRTGRPVELRDTMIAGIVVARHATLATRNLVHFEDLSVPVVNPWLV